MKARTLLLGIVLAIVLGACGDSAEPFQPGTAAPPVSTPGTSFPDPRAVETATLLRPGTSEKEVLYGEMNGVAPEEIVVLSEAEQGEGAQAPQPYLDAFAWNPPTDEWVKVFEATSFENPGGESPGPVITEDEFIGQLVEPPFGFVDFDGDETQELVVPVLTFGASSGPLQVWIFSWLSEAFTVDFYFATERGGLLTVGDDGASLVLESGEYGPDDPGCCPSTIATRIIAFDEASDRIEVVQKTEEIAPGE
jgi:hypothetical protein